MNGASAAGDLMPRYPITGIAACWAREANGHAATAPPTKRMNWRRLIVTPEAQTRNGSNLCQRSGGGFASGRTDVRFGSKADMCSAKGHVRFTPHSDRESGFQQTIMSALPRKADTCGEKPNIR